MLLSSVLSCCFLLHLIHNSGSLAPTHPSEVANFPSVCAFLSKAWPLSWEMAGPTISTHLFCGHFYVYRWPSWTVFVFFF